MQMIISDLYVDVLEQGDILENMQKGVFQSPDGIWRVGIAMTCHLII